MPSLQKTQANTKTKRRGRGRLIIRCPKVKRKRGERKCVQRRDSALVHAMVLGVGNGRPEYCCKTKGVGGELGGGVPEGETSGKGEKKKTRRHGVKLTGPGEKKKPTSVLGVQDQRNQAPLKARCRGEKLVQGKNRGEMTPGKKGALRR